jgi:hypothetical protein
MELNEFLDKWPNGTFLTAGKAARLLIDLRKTCKVLENDTYLYITNNSLMLSTDKLFADRTYQTNESSIIYPVVLAIYESGAHIPSGSPGADSGPTYQLSPHGTHTITLNDFYIQLPVTPRRFINRFFEFLDLTPIPIPTPLPTPEPLEE